MLIVNTERRRSRSLPTAFSRVITDHRCGAVWFLVRRAEMQVSCLFLPQCEDESLLDGRHLSGSELRSDVGIYSVEPAALRLSGSVLRGVEDSGHHASKFRALKQAKFADLH